MFFHLRHRFVAQAQHEVAALLLQAREHFVVFGEVAVAHVGGSGLELVAPDFAFAHPSRRDGHLHRFVFQQVKGHVQAHGAVGAPRPAGAVLRPAHAGQRRENGTVARQPQRPVLARIRRQRAGDFGAQTLDQFFQQARLQQMLGFGERPGAGGPGADFLLHALELVGGANGVERFDRRIDQREEEQTKIIDLLELALGVAPGRMGRRRGWQEGLESGAKIVEQLPLAEVLVGQFGRRSGHTASAAKKEAKYKLQSCDSRVPTACQRSTLFPCRTEITGSLVARHDPAAARKRHRTTR